MTSNKAFSLITGLVIVGVGVCGFLPQLQPLRTSQEVASKLAAIVFVSLFLIRNKWLKVFLAYCAVIVGVNLTKQSLIVLQTLFVFMVLYQTIADHLNKERIEGIFNSLCCLALLQAFVMFLQYGGIWPIFFNTDVPKADYRFFPDSWYGIEIYVGEAIKAHRNNLTGFTSNPNMASALLGLCVPAFLRKGWWLGIPVIFTALVLNSCLQGILMAGIVISAYFVYQVGKRYKEFIPIAICICVSAAIIYLFFSKEYVHFVRVDRLVIWKYCIQHLIPLKPIVGIGLGHGQRTWSLIKQGTGLEMAFTHPHNEFIFLTLETGLIGLGLILGYLTTSLYKFIKKLDSIKLLVLLGVIAGLLNCMVSFTIHVTIGIILLIYLSIMQHFNQEVTG